MKKQIIRLTESDLHRIIKESVKKILKEDYREPWQDEYDKYIESGSGTKPEEGTALRKKYQSSLASAYPDEKSRINALNKYIREREARRELRKTPEELAAEKPWEIEYNAKHGISDDDDAVYTKKEIDPSYYRRKKMANFKHEKPTHIGRTMSDDELNKKLEAMKQSGAIK